MASIAQRVGAAVKALRATPAALEMLSAFGGRYFAYPRSDYVDGAYIEMQSASYAHIYASQENVRMVVDAIARHAAKRSLKCYERESNGSKEEDSDFIAAETMRTPNDFQSGSELLGYMVHDKLVYDDAYLWDFGAVEDGRRFLLRVPPHAMGVKSDNKLHPSGYRVIFQDGSGLNLSTEEVIHWRGYSADSNRIGVSPCETLRTLLLESATRKRRMIEMVKGGLVKGGIITRPLEAPEWSSSARERFETSFAASLSGTSIGGVAMLEDGMQFLEAGITPREAEILESKKFDLSTICNLWGVNPAYFSTEGNLAQAREMMEEDVVSPLLKGLGDTLTHQLIKGTYSDEDHFFRFRQPVITDLNKLFEAGTKATGGAVLTPSEFREDYLDKPPAVGLLVIPGATQGSTPPAPGSAPRGRQPKEPEDQVDPSKEIELMLAKAQDDREKASVVLQGKINRREGYKAAHESLLRKHFLRQQRQQDSGQFPHLNQERWDRELAKDLLDLAREIVAEEGGIAAADLGSTFDSGKTKNYLTAGADAMAKSINSQTYLDVSDAIAIDGIKAASGIYKSASEDRATALAETRATQLAAWSVMEAARQLEE